MSKKNPNEPQKDKEALDNAKKAGVENPEELIFRPVSEGDIAYLKDRVPFMQLISANDDRQLSDNPKYIQAKSGWIIYDYGDALCASPGALMFDGGDYRIRLQENKKGDDGGAGTAGFIINGGHGTLVKQAVDTGAEMIWIAMERKWPGAVIVDGHRWMKWGAWMLAEDREYPVAGFVPSEEDRQRRARLRRKAAELDSLRMRLRQK